MKRDVRVVRSHLHAMGRGWHTAADQVDPVLSALDGAYLEPSAFFIGSTQVDSAAYHDFVNRLVRLLGQGQRQFDLIGSGLKVIADDYGGTDAENARDLNRIFV